MKNYNANYNQTCNENLLFKIALENINAKFQFKIAMKNYNSKMQFKIAI